MDIIIAGPRRSGRTTKLTEAWAAQPKSNSHYNILLVKGSQKAKKIRPISDNHFAMNSLDLYEFFDVFVQKLLRNQQVFPILDLFVDDWDLLDQRFYRGIREYRSQLGTITKVSLPSVEDV